MTSQAAYKCPICLSPMDEPPVQHAICPTCYVHFGYDDAHLLSVQDMYNHIAKQRDIAHTKRNELQQKIATLQSQLQSAQNESIRLRHEIGRIVTAFTSEVDRLEQLARQYKDSMVKHADWLSRQYGVSAKEYGRYRVAKQSRARLVRLIRARRGLRAALEAVEWDKNGCYDLCAWCGMLKSSGHAADCQRQRALGLSGKNVI